MIMQNHGSMPETGLEQQFHVAEAGVRVPGY
jgi:hypothetical protein